MVKVHFNETIQTVETYDAGDYDRTSVPIAELNDEEFNEIECYRLEMKKQTIEEYQKRWRKSRNSNSNSNKESLSSGSDSENLSPPLKSCLINKNTNTTSNITSKLNASAINAAMTVAMSSSLEDDTSYFGEGQAQPNIALNTPHSSEYNSDEGQTPKINVELSSSVDSTIETNPNENLRIFTEPDNEVIIEKDIKTFEDRNHLSVISPLSFESNDSPTSDNDADAEESGDDNNSFIRLFEDSFEKSSEEKEDGDGDGDSDYIKDMSLTEGENSITLSHHLLPDDIPTTSYRSSKPRLFTDSLFNYSPILSESVIDDKNLKNSQIQEETPDEDSPEEEEIVKVLEVEEPEGIVEEPEEVVEESEEEKEEDDDSDEEIDKHPHSDTFINYGGTQHINIKPRRNNIYDEYTGTSSCPFGKPISFLDDLPETIQSPLSTSLPSISTKKESPSKYTNFFGSPFSPPQKSPYRSNSATSSTSSYYSNRLNRYGSSSNYSTGSGSSNDGSYLVSKRNYLSISGNRDSKPKSYISSGHRLSNYTTSKWEGIGSRSSNKSNNNNNSLTSPSNKYYPRPATKLANNSGFSSSWMYDASF